MARIKREKNVKVKSVGTNVKYSIEGKICTIIVDLSKEYGLSRSGKTIRIASTEGNVRINEDVSLGLNVYKPK